MDMTKEDYLAFYFDLVEQMTGVRHFLIDGVYYHLTHL